MRLRKFIAATLAVATISALSACNEPAKPKTNDAKTGATTGDTTAATGAKKKTDPGAIIGEAAGAATANGKSAKYDDTKPALYATGPVAVIKGEPITAARYNEEVDRLLKAIKVIQPGAAENYKKMLLDRVINESIMDRKVAEHSIKVTDADYEKAWKEATARYGGPEKFETMITQRAEKDGGPTLEEVKTDIRRTAGYKKVVEKEFPFGVTEADAKAFYDKNATRFEQPEQVKASHILLELKRDATPEQVKAAETKAKKLSEQARKKGADFAKLARENSDGPTKTKGGDLGFFTRNKMVKPFADAAFELKDGEISDPVRSSFGYHVIKRTGNKPPSQIPFAEIKDRLTQDLSGQKERESLQKFIQKAEKDYKVERMDKNVVVNIDPKAAQAMPKPGGFNPHAGHGHGPNDGHNHGAPGKLKGLPPGALKLNSKQPPSVNTKKLKLDPKLMPKAKPVPK